MKICDEAVNNYSYALKFVPECYKIQEMLDKLSCVIYI